MHSTIGGQGAPVPNPGGPSPDPSDVALAAAALASTAHSSPASSGSEPADGEQADGEQAGSEPAGGEQSGHAVRTRAPRTKSGRKRAEAWETLQRPDFRRAVVAGAVALAAPGVDYWLGGVHAHRIGYRIGSFGAVFACLLFGVMAVRSAAGETERITRRRGGPAVAGTLRLLIIVVGYTLVAVTVLGLLYVPLDRLLLSGAITGVVVGIAAQQPLGNAFAGLVLLFSRPFAVGDYIVLRSGPMGGDYEGEVTAITLMYTILQTPEGPMTFPNSGVLAAVTGVREPPKVPDGEVA